MGEKPIQIARKNLRLLAENETREGSSALRIANVEKTETGGFRLNPRFVPPLLEVRASDYLRGLVNGILEILSAKSTQLSGSRRQKNQSLADFTTADIANFWLLYTVNSNIPVLSHLLQGQRCHPEELFSALTRWAPRSPRFPSTIRPRDLPLYDHAELSKVFTDLDEKLRLLLETVVPTNVVSLPLKQVNNTIYATAIDQDKYLTNTRMYLAVSRRYQRRHHHPPGAAAGEGLLGNPHRSAHQQCSARHHAHAHSQPAQRDSGQDEVPVLQPEPVGSRLGNGDARAQLRRARSG